MSKQERVFTEQELQEMGARTLDVVMQAIDSGDKARAKELAQRMYSEFQHLHDGYFFWVTGLQTYIYNHLGLQAVEEAERFAHGIEAKVVFKPSEKKDFRSRVEHQVGGLRGHLQPIKIEEDDDKVSITMQPCGSGERLIQMGGYDLGLAKIKDPANITWGLQDFPLYCIHCPIMEAMDVEMNGEFNTVHEFEPPFRDGSCHFVFYKDPAKIPEEYYTRIGKKKPESKK